MTRCQHCNLLTHSEDLEVYFEMKDFDKIIELQSLKNWKMAYECNPRDTNPLEIGKLKCGDIWIHFIAISKESEEK